MKYRFILLVFHLNYSPLNSTVIKSKRQIIFPGSFQDSEGYIYSSHDDFKLRQNSEKVPLRNLVPQDCGTRKAESSNQVFKRSADFHITDQIKGFETFVQVAGGFEAHEGQWPWAVVLGQSQGTFFKVICGGTLITHQHVLTAAHCFPSNPLADTKITHARLGQQDVSLSIDVNTAEDVVICDVRRHENYVLSTEVKNDIAVLKLCKKVDFGKYIQPACLPNPGLLNLSGNLTVVGWGSEKAGGGAVSALRQADVVHVPLTECQRRYSTIAKHIDNTHICAGKGATDTCAGDSGGPLLITVNFRWTVIGVTSFGVGCANENFPGVYTNVAQFMDWIRGKLF